MHAARGADAVYAVPAPRLPSLPVEGSEFRFPVRRIYCVGRNYLAHVREMGNDEKLPPLFFSKAADMIVESGSTIPYPIFTQNYQHEIELVVAMKSGGSSTFEPKWLSYCRTCCLRKKTIPFKNSGVILIVATRSVVTAGAGAPGGR